MQRLGHAALWHTELPKGWSLTNQRAMRVKQAYQRPIVDIIGLDRQMTGLRAETWQVAGDIVKEYGAVFDFDTAGYLLGADLKRGIHPGLQRAFQIRVEDYPGKQQQDREGEGIPA